MITEINENSRVFINGSEITGIDAIGIEKYIETQPYPREFSKSLILNFRDLNLDFQDFKICKKTLGYKINKKNTRYIFESEIICALNERQKQKWERMKDV